MHARFGHAVDDGGILVVTDWAGEERRMGSLPDRNTAAAATFQTFEDLLAASGVAVFTDSEIEAIAKSGIMDGRKKFQSLFVDDQHSHGSCNGYSEAGVTGNARYRRGEPLVKLSGAFAYSLMNGGRDNGSALSDAKQKCVDVGICRAEYCNWQQIYPSLYDRAKCMADAANFRGLMAYPATTLAGYWTGLAMGFDGGCAVQAGRSFMSTNSEGYAGTDNGGGNHAVRSDGIVWGSQGPTGTGVNSWGMSYGNGGRMLLHAGHFRQTFNNHMFWILPSSTDDATDDNKAPRLVFPSADTILGPRLVHVDAEPPRA
jgi:hypothetical protein